MFKTLKPSSCFKCSFNLRYGRKHSVYSVKLHSSSPNLSGLAVLIYTPRKNESKNKCISKPISLLDLQMQIRVKSHKDWRAPPKEHSHKMQRPLMESEYGLRSVFKLRYNILESLLKGTSWCSFSLILVISQKLFHLILDKMWSDPTLCFNVSATQ